MFTQACDFVRTHFGISIKPEEPHLEKMSESTFPSIGSCTIKIEQTPGLVRKAVTVPSKGSSWLPKKALLSDSLSACTYASRMTYNTFQRQQVSNLGLPRWLDDLALSNDAYMFIQVSLSRKADFYIRPLGRIRIATINLMSRLTSSRLLPLLFEMSNKSYSFLTLLRER